LITSFLTLGCAEPKRINGTLYDTYGLLNQDAKKNEAIQYEISYGNIFWSVILFETVFAPIYFIGFDLYEPIGMKQNFEPGVLK